MKNTSPYVKMRVLGAIEYAEGHSIRQRIKKVSEMAFEDEEGNKRRFTWRTIETWYVRYRKHGATAVTPRNRRDKGKTRKVLPEQVQEAIDQVLPQFRGKTPCKEHVYRACLEKGLLRRDRIAPNTFRRIVEQYEMLRSREQVHNKRRLAFSKQFANQMWQADTMHGPYVDTPQGKRQACLIAFIDDASRLVCHGEFFLAENTDSMIKALQSALYKRGIPEQLYVDNGSIYSSREMISICARLGTILSHTPVRDGAAKGKVERFFRTVRDQFLSRTLDLSSIEALNRSFIAWAEDEYNQRVHSTLEMKPIDRFGLDLKRIRFLPPNEANDELFFCEETRHVKNDNTFSFQGRRYEAPRDLRNRDVHVRFNRHNPTRLVVFHKDQRMGDAARLNPVANDRKPTPGEHS